MDQLEADARAFLEARRAPITASNLQSIKTFLSMNPDKRPSAGAEVTAPSDTTASTIEANVEKTLGNTNVPQQRALAKKTKIGVTETLPAQAQTTTPETAPAVSTEATPGNISDAPGAQEFVDPNNPPNAMAGVSNAPMVGDIGSVISRLVEPAIGAGTVAGGALLAAKGRLGAVRPPTSRAGTVGRIMANEPNVPAIAPQEASEAATAVGRANPIGHGRDTPLVQPEMRAEQPSLRQANRQRNRRRRKPQE